MVGADDADVGDPVADDGEDLVGVGDFAGDDEAAVFLAFVDDLGGDEVAALEVVGGGLGDAQDHFGFVGVEPDAVFGLQHGLVVRLAGEGGGGDAEGLDFAVGVGFELALIDRRQIPHARVVDQFVGLGVGVAFDAAVFLIAEGDEPVVFDGLFQLGEEQVFALQLFVLMAFDEQRAFQVVAQQLLHKLRIERAKQTRHPRQTRKLRDVLAVEFAKVDGFEAVMTVCVFFQL